MIWKLRKWVRRLVKPLTPIRKVNPHISGTRISKLSRNKQTIELFIAKSVFVLSDYLISVMSAKQNFVKKQWSLFFKKIISNNVVAVVNESFAQCINR